MATIENVWVEGEKAVNLDRFFNAETADGENWVDLADELAVISTLAEEVRQYGDKSNSREMLENLMDGLAATISNFDGLLMMTLPNGSLREAEQAVFKDYGTTRQDDRIVGIPTSAITALLPNPQIYVKYESDFMTDYQCEPVLNARLRTSTDLPPTTPGYNDDPTNSSLGRWIQIDLATTPLALQAAPETISI